MERLVPLCRVDELSQLIEQERRTARGITGRSAETSLCRYRHKEVYGRKKRGVAYNYQGQRAGRPHVAAWAETEIVLAADLGSGTDDPRASAPDLLRRALAGLPERIRAGGRVAARADAGYFAGQVARAAHDEHIFFALGARRIAPLWRLPAASAKTAGPMPSTWTMPRSRWPITGRTGGRRT